jgi:hypothetical protein
MPFHYQRSPGEQGGVGRAEGDPPGTRLSDLLAAGLPTERAALEIGVALCEISYIAEDDGNTHGGLDLSEAWLTGDGIVSIGGYGVERARTRAPEGKPRGPATDRYGLGLMLAKLLAHGAEALHQLPMDEAPAHDLALEDWLDRADLGDVPEATDHELRRVIGHLLTFDRMARAEALTAWRAARSHVAALSGPPMRTWAEAAHRGTAPRREPRRPGDERLGRAEAQPGPLQKPLAFSALATKTQYWRIEPEDVAAATAGDKSGRWTLGELRAMWKEATGDTEPSLTPAERERSFRPDDARPSRSGRTGSTEAWGDPPAAPPPPRPRTDPRAEPPARRAEPPEPRPAEVRRPAEPRASDGAPPTADRRPPPGIDPRGRAEPRPEEGRRRLADRVNMPPAEPEAARPPPPVTPPRPTRPEVPPPPVRPTRPEAPPPVSKIATQGAVQDTMALPPPEPLEEEPAPTPSRMPLGLIAFFVVCAIVFVTSCMLLLGVIYWKLTHTDAAAPETAAEVR